MADSDTKLKSIKSEIRSLLVSCPIGMSIQSFLNDYKECIGCPLPFSELGFKSAIGFFKSLTDVVELKETSKGTLLIPIESKNSSHINNLVCKQKSVNPKKRARSRYSRARTVKQGNHTYYQSIKPRTNMHFEISEDLDGFNSDELDHLDIVWTKDSQSEEDDLIHWERKNNGYRKVSPPPISCPQHNEPSPPQSSVNFSSDEETDYEVGFKEPNNSSLIKKPSLFQYDSTTDSNHDEYEENILKSNSNSNFSAGSSLYHVLKESPSSNFNKEKSLKIQNPINFKRFLTGKCDVSESSSVSDILRKEDFHTALNSYSSALDKASNQEKQSDDDFYKTSPIDYETKSRNVEHKVQSDDTQSSTIEQNSMGNSFSSSNLQKIIKSNRDSAYRELTLYQRDTADTENISKSDFSKNIRGRSSSSMTYDCHEFTKLSPTFSEEAGPVLRKSVLFTHDTNENEHFSDKLVKNVKLDNDCTLRRPQTPSGNDYNEYKSSFLNHQEAEDTIQQSSMENSFSSSYSEETVKSNCNSSFRQLTPYQHDSIENITADKKVMKPDFFKNIHERPSSPFDYNRSETTRLCRKFSGENSNCHPELRRSNLFSYDLNENENSDNMVKNVKYDNDCTLIRFTPSDHDYNEIKSSLDYKEDAEAASALRMPSSKLYSSASSVTSKKSDTHSYYTESSSSDCFGNRMRAEDHPAVHQLSLYKNDSTSYNIASTAGHKISKSNQSSDKKQVEKKSAIDVSEDHEFYLWALVNGIILDEAKIKQPLCQLINLTKKSNNNFSKKDLETIKSIDNKMGATSNQQDHCQIDYKKDEESNRYNTKLIDYFLSIEKNICINCELKVNKCVCLGRNNKLKDEIEFENNTCDCFKHTSKCDKPLTSNNKFSGMGRGELFKEKLIKEKRLGLNDNNPLVNLNVGRGAALKKLLHKNSVNDGASIVD